MKKNKLIIIILFIILLSTFQINSQTKFYTFDDLKLFISTGFNFNFSITTDFEYKQEYLALDFPLIVGVDLRRHERFSLYGSIEISYGFSRYNQLINSDIFSNYYHNIFIKTPFVLKVYPLTHINEIYHNFYFGIGTFLHFWILNYYYTTTTEGAIHSGNAYNPKHPEIPPGNIYTPVNIGMRLTFGNNFYISNKTLFGIEFQFNYLFLPTINGYYSDPNYDRGNNIILEFTPSVGGIFSIGIDLTN